jgi:PAS domain S-box-containing protein
MKDQHLKRPGPHTFELIIDSLRDYAIFTTDKEGIVTSWNAGAEQVLLYKPEEIIGKSAEVLFTPEDVASGQAAMELRNSLHDGRAINERFHVKNGGGRFWGSGLVYPMYDRQNEHIGFTKIMQNVSDEAQAQRNLQEEQTLAQTLVSSYSEPLVILDKQMKVVEATTAFLNYFSINGQQLIGRDFYRVMDEDIKLPDLKLQLEPALKGYQFHRDMEVGYDHPKEGRRSLVIKLRHIYQRPNQLFSLQFEDQTKSKAEIAKREDFISVASHEVRTPISIIRAYGQILDKELKNAKPVVRRAVDKINQHIGDMSNLIAALLDTSKINTGRLELDLEVFNLSELVRETVEGFALTASSHTINLTGDVESMVYADRVRTGSVITNLLSNAVKYSPGAPHINVKVVNSAAEVTVSVQDFGMGIAEHERSDIFQRFGRAETVRKSRIPGTGLGLHLAAEIIRLEGGQIGFSSEPGKGSTFYFSLPLYQT